MKKIIVFSFFAISLLSFCQEKIEIRYLYKEWELNTLEKKGIIKTAEEFDKNESITFYSNNKFKMRDSEQNLKGFWKINYFTREIELNIVELNQKIILKIIDLKEDLLSCIFEELDDKMILHFKSVALTQNIKKGH